MAVDSQTFNLRNLESEIHLDYAFEDILSSLPKKKVINFHPRVKIPLELYLLLCNHEKYLLCVF